MLSLSLAARERAVEALVPILRPSEGACARAIASGIVDAIGRRSLAMRADVRAYLARTTRADSAAIRALIRAYVAALDEHARVVCLMTRGPDDRAAAEHEARVLRMHAIAVERSLPTYERALAQEWPGLAAEVAREVERIAEADAAAKVERKAKTKGAA